MKTLLYVYNTTNYIKLYNDLIMIKQGQKSPINVYIETYLNEFLKNQLYKSLIYNR